MADRKSTREEGLRRAIEVAGGINALARLIGVTAPAVAQWKRVPVDRIVSVEIVTGIPREELRPDLYRQ